MTSTDKNSTDEKLDALRTEVRAMRDELRELRALVESRLSASPREKPGDVLSLKDAAREIGVQPSTLRDGGAGTSSIPRFR
jgi:hypothetical protein